MFFSHVHLSSTTQAQDYRWFFQRPFSSRFSIVSDQKNLHRETAKQLVVKRLSSTMRRKCACSRFNGIDWVWSKSPFGQIIYRRTSGSAGPFQFRPRDFSTGGRKEGRKRGKKKKERKKGGRERGRERERAWFRFLIVNSKFNSSQKRVQSRMDELTRSAKSVLI